MPVEKPTDHKWQLIGKRENKMFYQSRNNCVTSSWLDGRELWGIRLKWHVNNKRHNKSYLAFQILLWSERGNK